MEKENRNLYEVALDNAINDIEYKHHDFGVDVPKKRLDEIKLLQELVDKETPKKIIKLPYKDIYGNKIEDSKTYFFNGCPNCKGNVGIQAEYCRHCGQKLEWEED